MVAENGEGVTAPLWGPLILPAFLVLSPFQKP
jgi:hypothetical protein